MKVDGILDKCLKSVEAVIGLTLVKSDKLLSGCISETLSRYVLSTITNPSLVSSSASYWLSYPGTSLLSSVLLSLLPTTSSIDSKLSVDIIIFDSSCWRRRSALDG